MVLSSAGTPVVMVVTFWKCAASMIFVHRGCRRGLLVDVEITLEVHRQQGVVVVVDEGEQRLPDAAVLLVDDEVHPLGIGQDLVGGRRLGELDALLGQVVRPDLLVGGVGVTGDGALEQVEGRAVEGAAGGAAQQLLAELERVHGGDGTEHPGVGLASRLAIRRNSAWLCLVRRLSTVVPGFMVKRTAMGSPPKTFS